MVQWDQMPGKIKNDGDRGDDDDPRKCICAGLMYNDIGYLEFDEMSQLAKVSAEEEIGHVLKSVLDKFQQDLTTRFNRLNDLNSKYGFLLDVRNLVENEDLTALRANCFNLANFYDTDVDGNDLFNKICDCKMMLITRGDALPSTPLELLSFIVSYEDDVFPNLRIALQILLTIAVSTASC